MTIIYENGDEYNGEWTGSFIQKRKILEFIKKKNLELEKNKKKQDK